MAKPRRRKGVPEFNLPPTVSTAQNTQHSGHVGNLIGNLIGILSFFYLASFVDPYFPYLNNTFFFCQSSLLFLINYLCMLASSFQSPHVYDLYIYLSPPPHSFNNSSICISFRFRSLSTSLRSSMATAEVQSVTHVISSEPTKVESCEPVEKPESEAVDNTTAAEIAAVEEKPVLVIEKEEGEEVIVEEKKLQVEADKKEEEVVSKEVEGDEEAAVEVPAQAAAEEDAPVPAQVAAEADTPAQVAAEADAPAQVAAEADAPAQVAAEAEEPPLAATVIEVGEDKEACKETPAETPGVEEESKE